MDRAQKSGHSKHEFPFPSLSDPDRVMYINLNKANKHQLKEHCLDYRLDGSGTKVNMLERLKGFSENKEQWKLLQPNSLRSHRGSRTDNDTAGGKKKRIKGWEARRLEQGYAAPMPGLKKGTHQGLAERMTHTRTAHQKAQLLEWANRLMDSCPEYQKPMPTKRPNMATATSALLTSSDTEAILRELDTVKQMIKTADSAGNSVVTTQLGTAEPSPVPSTSMPSTAMGVPQDPYSVSMTLAPSEPLSPPSMPTSTSTLTAPHLPSLTPLSVTDLPQPSKGRFHVLVLGNGTRLEFYDSDVPENPSTFSPAKDINMLFDYWDDASLQWDGEKAAALNIVPRVKGVPIAIKYWDQVYKYGRRRQWEGIKKKWSKWNYIVQYYTQVGKAAFWAEFSDTNGKRLSITAISKLLLAQRKARDEEDAQRAREEFAKDFADTFTDERGRVLSDITAIAKQYRKLRQS